MMRTLRSILEALLWLALIALLLFAIVFVLAQSGRRTPPLLFYLIPLALLVIAAPLAGIAGALRRRRAAAVVTYVEQAVRLNLPLTRMLDAAQRSEDPPLSKRLSMLSQQLALGRPLGDAIEATVPEVTAADASLIAAAEELGRLPHTLSRLARRHSLPVAGESAVDTPFLSAYPFLLVVVITAAVSLLAIFVMPKFEAIFRDFDLPLPAITQTTLSAAATLGPPLAIAAAIVFLIWALSPMLARWDLMTELRDRARWMLPVTHGLARDRGLADALDLLADAVRAGQPVESALQQSAALRINTVLRDRFSQWERSTREGAALDRAAHSARMPRLVVQMLAPVRGVEQAADVLAFLARYYDARFSRTRVLIQAASVPLMVFFFAWVVLCIALSMFMPMIALLDSIMQQPLPTW